jgi:alginate O-acetyltransferase complex protein AlgI
MLFNSLHFLIFFPIVVFLYYSLPFRYRWVLLLFASYYFYMAWKAEYVFLILFSTLIDYFSALMMAKTNNKRKKNIFLALSLVSNIGLLFIFKYFNFFSESTRDILNHFNIFYDSYTFSLLLPVGISFYTFQTLSYTFDVYRGKIKPEKHFGIFALYVSFFPQLVAGPIERSSRLLPQFYQKTFFEYNRIAEGLSLMLWGFFKKIVIADNAAKLVNIVYNNPEGFHGTHFIIATVLFAFQIFCDFSGYSDIAIGSAKVMGYDLMKNFRRPYFANSVSDFWNRWHISLSSWFRDYLYIPLGGSRSGKLNMYRNLAITFLISGFWHGANWTFIIWGFLHAFYIVIGKITKEYRNGIITLLSNNFPSVHHFMQVCFIFTLVCFAWIFFRANTLDDAWYIISNLFVGVPTFVFNIFDISYVKSVLSAFETSPFDFVLLFASIIFLITVQVFKKESTIRSVLIDKPVYLRWGFYYVLILWILFFGNFGEEPFIYFQF